MSHDGHDIMKRRTEKASVCVCVHGYKIRM